MGEDLQAFAIGDVSQVPDRHRIKAAEVEASVVAQEVVGLPFISELASKLFGSDIDFAWLIDQGADLIYRFHLAYDSYYI